MKEKKTFSMEELEQMKKEPKEKRLVWYFDMLKLPSEQRPDSETIEEMLGLSEDDCRAYQAQKEKEVSMPSGEKRKKILKEVIKPLLKKAGFHTKGPDWWKELTDGWLLIHMKNSNFNSPVTGCSFGFLFSASIYGEVGKEINKQWINNQMRDLRHDSFLPYGGRLSPYYGVGMYQIDGYENYLPKDDPVEEISAQIRKDFETYILPQIKEIHSIKDWNRIYKEKQEYVRSRECRILNFYHSVCMGVGISGLQWSIQENELTSEELLSHLDWLEIICKHSSWPNEDRVSQVKCMAEKITKEKSSKTL